MVSHLINCKCLILSHIEFCMYDQSSARQIKWGTPPQFRRPNPFWVQFIFQEYPKLLLITGDPTSNQNQQQKFNFMQIKLEATLFISIPTEKTNSTAFYKICYFIDQYAKLQNQQQILQCLNFILKAFASDLKQYQLLVIIKQTYYSKKMFHYIHIYTYIQMLLLFKITILLRYYLIKNFKKYKSF
eukprot:TRINITY_DN632_c0_g1_i5.p3 TRINITY_DN632_c0_g1~~TRINITY_DN632_c0_g1_i5.p3  ORF type:complete len:186 (-),score=-21.73 TRINITY_DN632_c0_g1_i5:1565-2122(-)